MQRTCGDVGLALKAATVAVSMHRRLHDRIVTGPAVVVLVAASALAGAFSGAHPTGTSIADPLYDAALAGVVTAAGSIAGRATILWLAAVAAGFARGYVIFPAGAALVGAFVSSLSRRAVPALGAAVSGAAVQVLLRERSFGFFGASALVGAAAILPCLVHAFVRLPRRVRNLMGLLVGLAAVAGIAFSAVLAGELLASKSEVTAGTAAAESALSSVSAGEAASAQSELVLAARDFASASARIASPWAAPAKLVPVVSQQRRAVLTAARVAAEVAAVSGEEASKIDFAGLHYQSGGIDLASLSALAGPLGRVDSTLETGLARIAATRSPWLLGPVQSRLQLLESKLSSAAKSSSLAAEAVRDAPSLLGSGGERRYMVAFMDTSESRGLGGLVVSYALVSANNGKLSFGGLHDISYLGGLLAEHGGGKITGLPGYTALYGQNPAEYPQNITYAPDLPTVSEVAAQLYSESGEGSLDGLMVLDPRSLAAMLNLTGPIDVAGLGTLDAANAAGILERGQYLDFPEPSEQPQRRAALGEALSEAVSRLTDGTLPGPSSLSATLDPVVRSGDMLFWSLHPSVQPLLERLGLAGRFPQAGGGDLIGVVTANAAASKIDVYLHRTIDASVSYDPASGEVTDDVTVTLDNTAPPSGLPAEILGTPGPGGPNPGTSSVWLSLYSPLSLDSATLGSKALDVSTGTQFAVKTYSAFLDVASESAVTVTYRLSGKVEPGSYRLSVYSQPMVEPDSTTVTVRDSELPAGPAQLWDPAGKSRNFRVFSFRTG